MESNEKKLITHFAENRVGRGAQRRKNARIPMELPCVFSIAHADDIIQERGTITSLSTGGLAVRTRVVLVVGDKIQATFDLGGMTINEVAEITRITGTEVGMRFTEPAKKTVEYIQQYIYNRVFSKK